MAVTVAGDEGNIVAPWKITVVYRVSVDRPPALRRPWAPGIAIYSDPAPAQVCIHALEITKGMLFGWCMSQTIMAWPSIGLHTLDSLPEMEKSLTR